MSRGRVIICVLVRRVAPDDRVLAIARRASHVISALLADRALRRAIIMTQSNEGSRDDDPRNDDPAISGALAKIAKEARWPWELTRRVAELRVPLGSLYGWTLVWPLAGANRRATRIVRAHDGRQPARPRCDLR